MYDKLTRVLIVALALVLCGIGLAAKAQTPKPNIVIIVADDHDVGGGVVVRASFAQIIERKRGLLHAPWRRAFHSETDRTSHGRNDYGFFMKHKKP